MKISYFAWLKDKVGIAEEEIILPTEVTNVNMLIDWLSSRGQNYREAFEFSEVLKVAINEAYAHGNHPVTDDDEIIFFPPIAGG
jgi:molybdopterin synthase sulfur carrier subunit